MVRAILLLILLLPTLQEAGQTEQILDRGDKLLEEAKAAYEQAREKASAAGFVDAGFKLEDARIKYIVLQEIGNPDKQKIAAERLRSVNQLAKLIHDGKVAISGAPAEAPPTPPPPTPGEPAKPAPAPVKVDVNKRVPVPDAAKLKDAEKLIRDLYKEQYAKKTQADRKSLARMLLAEAPKNRNDQVVLWVLCREAQDQAVQGCDLPTAMKAIDEAGEVFDIDGMALRNAALAATSKTAKTPEESAGVVTASFKTIDELVANDQYDAADKLAQSMMPLSKKAGNVLLFTQLTARAKEVADAKVLYQGMKSVLETLAKTPDDPLANFEMGKFLCFVKGNWDLGLRFVVKGSDPTLKGLAEKELSNPEPVADRVFLADAWRELADKEKSTLRKSRLQAHATALYEEALPGATGLLRTKIEKILDADAVAGALAKGINLLTLIDLKTDVVAGSWQLEGRLLVTPSGKLDRMQIPYIPPEEYDLYVDIERAGPGSLALGLVTAGCQFNITFDGWTPENTGLDLLDMKSANNNESTVRRALLPTGRPTSLVVSIKKDGVQLVVDGVKTIDWKGNPRRLTLWENWKVQRNDVLFLGVNGGPFRIRKFSIVEVTGKGRKLR